MDQALTTLGLFDEVTSDTETALTIVPRILTAFITFTENQEVCRVKWNNAVIECKLLKDQLRDSRKEIASLERQVQTARRLLDEEKSKRQRAIEERNYVENQLGTVRELLKDNRNKLNDETKEKLHFLGDDKNSIGFGDKLDTITELESTGSVMSDLSYTRDEEDLLNLSGPETRSSKRQRPSTAPGAVKPKRRRSSKTLEAGKSECLIATTTVTLGKKGPMSATSVIESIPTTPQFSNRLTVNPSAPPLSDSDSEFGTVQLSTPTGGFPFSMNSLNTRPHNFQQKAMIKADMCNVCSKRLRFSQLGMKCRDCKTICHTHCKDGVPIPCVPIGNTPTSKNSAMGGIADYTPMLGPMVPSLLIHCVKEVEARGLSEVGVYRIPGSDKEVKALKEKFLKNKGVPNLSQVCDLHTICGCIKDFLRSLKEPLVTQIRWGDFSRAATITDPDDRKARLYQIISELPQPNRDTLAFMVLHLQRVAEAVECKMPISNLAKMFGPTIVGLPSHDPGSVYADTNRANTIMSELLVLPTEYWENFIKGNNNELKYLDPEIQKTPSTNSLMNFFSTPGRSVNFRLKKRRYFDTP